MAIFESTTDNFVPAFWPIKVSDVTELRIAFLAYIADEKLRLQHEMTFLNEMSISELDNVVGLTKDALVLAADSELSRLIRGTTF